MKAIERSFSHLFSNEKKVKVEVETGSTKTAIGHRFIQMNNLKAEVKKGFIFPFWGGFWIFSY